MIKWQVPPICSYYGRSPQPVLIMAGPPNLFLLWQVPPTSSYYGRSPQSVLIMAGVLIDAMVLLYNII